MCKLCYKPLQSRDSKYRKNVRLLNDLYKILGHIPLYALKVTQDNSLIVCYEQRNLSILKSAKIVIALRTISYTVLSFLSNSDFRFAIYKSDKLQYCPDCVNCNFKGIQHCCIEWTGRRIRKEAKGNSALYIVPVSCSITFNYST